METTEIQIHPSWLKTFQYKNLKFNSAFDFRLNSRDLVKAYHELNERENEVIKSIQKLKKKLERDEDFLYRTDDSYLLPYLRVRKFNCDKAYNSMRRLYSLRAKYPEYFALPPNLKTLLNNNFVTCLPYKDGEGRILFLVDFRNWNLDEMSMNEVFLAMNTIYDVISANPHSQIQGVVGIWDFQGLSLRHVSQIMRPSVQRFAVRILQECYPWRIKFIFGVNCNALARTFYAAVRYLLKSKLADRIHILGSDLTELHKHVNPAVLPKEYGGTLEESECNITDLIMDNMNYLEYERTFGLKKVPKLR